MHFPTLLTSASIALSSIAGLTSAHNVFRDAVGDANPKIHGYALGFDPSLKYEQVADLYKKGKAKFYSDLAIDVVGFKNHVIGYGPAHVEVKTGCGSTPRTALSAFFKSKTAWKGLDEAKRNPFLMKPVPHGGQVNVAEEMGILASRGGTFGVPQVTAGGSLTIVNYQINVDGAGPFDCYIDNKGLGNVWGKDPLTVRTTCGGNPNSVGMEGMFKNCTVTVAMPKGLGCTGAYNDGKQKNICMVRCQNRAKNGLFGGCVPVQLV
ncbi:hypothetical protein TWF718_006395 [Orbilia javanica]|uniref:Uncharacterized protein n=1 Tax=Orbilia javanica TaxID=47235 RepID=A0AAN8NYE3_9PEZI